MVFTELMIIKGTILSTEQLFEMAKKLDLIHNPDNNKFQKLCVEIYELWKSEEDDLRYEIIESVNVYLKNYPGNLEIYRFPCCTENEDSFIFGECIKSFDRIVIKCDKCPNQYICCDKCIGYTTNGYYDVVKILNEPVIAKKEDVEDIDPTSFYINKFSKKILDKTFDTEFYYLLNDCLSCT